MSKYKVSHDVAEIEFERFCEEMDICPELSIMGEKDRTDFNVYKEKIILSMMRGNLVIDDKGQPVFSPVGEDDKGAITFYEPEGLSLGASDDKKPGKDVSKMYAIMAQSTRQPIIRFNKMKQRNLRICIAISSLFLG